MGAFLSAVTLLPVDISVAARLGSQPVCRALVYAKRAVDRDEAHPRRIARVSGMMR